MNKRESLEFSVLATRCPGAVALRTGAQEVSFADLHANAAQSARVLVERGVGAGDRVALFASASVESIAALLALLELGAVACPLSTRLPRAGIVDALRRLGTGTLIADRTCGVDYIPLEEIADARGAKGYVAASDPGRPAVIVFTSGSSGGARPAVHSYRSLMANASASNENIVLLPGDRWLLSLPLYHVGGLGILFRCLLAGATIAVPGEGEDLAESIRRYRPTHVSLVATQLYRLLRDDVELSGLKTILLGGSAMPAGLVRTALDRGLPVYTSYGLTEMASQVTTTVPGDTAEHLRTSGKPLRDSTLSISSAGEIIVRGETLFEGYLRNGELTRPLDAGGGFATGDLGFVDGDGYLHVTGRKDNMFISGGENVQPEEIEAALCAIDAIESAIVVPIDDPEFGQRPVAFVRPYGDASAILAELEPVLPRFKLPVAIYPWPDDIVETGIKASRAAFRERARDI